MITIQNGKFNIPESDRFIGFAGDNLNKTIEFLVKGEEKSADIYRLYLVFDDTSVNHFVLPSTLTNEGVLLKWDILEGHIFKGGIVKLQIKAFRNDGVIWHTNTDTLIVGKSAEFPDNPDSQKNSEFLEYERLLNEIRDEIEEERVRLPYIGENGNWFVFDVSSNTYIDSGKPSAGMAENFEITDGYISNSMLSDNVVTKEKISPFAVSRDKIANKAVDSSKLDRAYWCYLSNTNVMSYEYLNQILELSENGTVYRMNFPGLSPMRSIVGTGNFMAFCDFTVPNQLIIININNLDVWSYTKNSNTIERVNKLKTPYDVAVDNGFLGTEVQWLDSLKGANGYTPQKGLDYWTEADKEEINDDNITFISMELSKREQLKPEFANGIDECTDTTKLYVLPDGYIYTYSKNQVVPSITITSAVGCYYTSDGVLIEEPGMSCKYTNIIPVTAGDKFSYTGRGLWLAVSVLWYDENDKVVSSAVYNDNNEVTTLEVTVPEGASKVRFVSVIASSKVDDVILDISWVLCQTTASQQWTNTGHAFVPADYEDRIFALENKAQQSEKISPLKGKKIVYDGDSICYGWSGNGGAYPKLIADRVGGTYVNEAVGGARLVTLESGGSYHSVVDNLENLPKDGDLYCFDGGMNDYWTHGKLGDYDLENFTGELDETTVCGALETIFRYCINNFQGKPVCFVIVHKCQSTAYAKNPYGNSFADYREKMVGICEKYSVPYYDAFAKSGLNGWNNAQNSLYLTANSEGTPDGCHPNEEGYKRYYVPQLISLFESIMPIE